MVIFGVSSAVPTVLAATPGASIEKSLSSLGIGPWTVRFCRLLIALSAKASPASGWL